MSEPNVGSNLPEKITKDAVYNAVGDVALAVEFHRSQKEIDKARQEAQDRLDVFRGEATQEELQELKYFVDAQGRVLKTDLRLNVMAPPEEPPGSQKVH